jgi:hypothetical protein
MRQIHGGFSFPCVVPEDTIIAVDIPLKPESHDLSASLVK